MKLVFESISMEHYGCLKTQSVQLDALGYGVHFVQGVNKFKPRLGSNGVGKSSIWNALCWCLTGTTLSGLKSTEVRPWGSKHVTTVVVTLRRDDKIHDVKRSTVSNGLWIDDKVVSQDEIDRLTGLTSLTIRHTILLGQGQELFFDLKPTGKMEILSECLDLDKWEARSERAKAKARELETDMSVLVAEIAAYEQQLLGRQHDVRDLKRLVADWESEKSDRIEKRESALKVLKKQLDVAMKELGDFDLAYDGAECELRHIRKQLMSHSKALQEKTVECADVQATFNALERVVSDLRKTAKSGKCAACGQVIKDKQAHAEHASVEIEKQEKARKACESQLNKRLEEQRKLRVATTTLRQHEDAFNEKSNDAIDGRTRAQGKVQQIKAEIKAHTTIIEDEQENPHSVLLNKARQSIVELKRLIADLTDKLNRAQRRHTRTKYWVHGFRDVRLYLLQEVLDELQGVTQTMLPSIGLDGWEVEYAMERETKAGKVSMGLNVTITMDNGKPVNWKAWSGGEGQRLRVLGAIALSDVLLRRAGVECDMLVLDEPTKHLSPEGVMETVDFLVDRGKQQQVFYVDHSARPTNRFANVMTVTRNQKGFSTINVEPV